MVWQIKDDVEECLMLILDACDDEMLVYSVLVV